jgi:hypothetical protein
MDMLRRLRASVRVVREWQEWKMGRHAEPEPDELHRGVGTRRAAATQGKPPIVAVLMQVAVSLVLLCVGLYIILSRSYEAETQKWAFGVVGIVVGFWLS